MECSKPVSLSTTNITATSAKIKWPAEDSAVNFQVKYRVSGGSWLKVNANSNSKTLKDLAPSTTYEWKVKTKCVKDPKVYGKFSLIKNFTIQPLKETVNVVDGNDNLSISVYPNPFKDVSTITLFLSENSFITVSLFDAQERKVQAVAEGKFSSGFHQVQLTAKGITAGIYFLQMKTGADVLVQKDNVE
ncbi:MAG: T9SS type A sorting domain-containing protein [Chitinophagales bacterium]